MDISMSMADNEALENKLEKLWSHILQTAMTFEWEESDLMYLMNEQDEGKQTKRSSIN